MKSTSKISSLAALLVLLGASGCGSHAPAKSDGALLTSVAQTAEAQFPIYATAIPAQPSDTPSPVPTSTIAIFPTLTPYNTVAYAPTSSPCNDAAYVADVTFPDNSVVAPSASFNKTWSIRNSGTCTWDTGYSITFLSGTQMDGQTTTLGGSVAPGSTTNVTVAMVSPGTAGTYTGWWRMADDSGSRFGESVSVVIQVSTSVTSTPTITPTASKTSATTSTAAATATFTSVPATSTAVPSSTTAPQPTNTSTPVPPTSTPAPPTATPSALATG